MGRHEQSYGRAASRPGGPCSARPRRSRLTWNSGPNRAGAVRVHRGGGFLVLRVNQSRKARRKCTPRSLSPDGAHSDDANAQVNGLRESPNGMRASTPLEIDGGAESESEPVWRCNLCGHETTTGKDMAGSLTPAR